MGAILSLLQLLPFATDLVTRGLGLKSSTGALIQEGAELVARGLALFKDISDAGSKPGGPTDEDVARVKAEYDISDDELHGLLTGGQS